MSAANEEQAGRDAAISELGVLREQIEHLADRMTDGDDAAMWGIVSRLAVAMKSPLDALS